MNPISITGTLGPIIPQPFALVGTQLEPPAQAPAEPTRAPRDTLAIASGQARSAGTEDATRAPRDANPFAELRSDSAAQRERLENPAVGLDKPLDFTGEQLARLACLQSKLLGKAAPLPSGMQQAVLLLTHDAHEQAKRGASGLDEKALRMASERLARGQTVTHEEATAFWRTITRNAAAAQIDVQSLVSRVLRESYMLSSEIMFELAERLKRTNELRKAIRSELDRARTARTAGASLGEQDRLAAPFGLMAVDRDALSLVPELVDQEDIENAIAQRQAADQAASNLAEAAHDFHGASTLDERERYALEAATTGDDDHVKDNLGNIMKVLPKLRADDLLKYLGRAFRALEGGNTDEDAIFDLFNAMSPEQALFMVSKGFDNDFFEFGGSDRTTFAALLTDKAIELVGSVGLAPGWVPQPEPSKVSPDGWAALAPALTPMDRREAQGVLDEVAARRATAADEPSAPLDLIPTYGARRTARTPKELDDYIQRLEEDLNSQGEDAQLQNVTLQDQLQRQQHALQMISSIARMLHDTAMSVVRKLGG